MLLNLVKAHNIVAGDQCNGTTRLASTSCAADSVDIAVLFVGHVIVNDQGQLFNMDAPCGHIGGHQYMIIPLLKLLDAPDPPSLGDISVECMTGQSLAGEEGAYPVHRHARIAEYHTAFGLFYKQQSMEPGILFIVIDPVVELLDGINGLSGRFYLDGLRILHIAGA